MSRILCVAEKPSIAKAVAGHLSGGTYQTHNTRETFIKNYVFDYDFGPPWGACSVTMTSVIGHLTGLDVGPELKNWSYPPPERLFDCPVMVNVPNDKKNIAKNIEEQARRASALFIWTDCDREGEHIGGEIRDAAKRGNHRIEVRRARFSNIERVHILNAARNLVNLDERQIEAVNARIELDLRIGYAFTRFLTLNLRNVGPELNDLMISYGSCQFPTLGFVVDRYFRVKNFVPETFWAIKVMYKREKIDVNFHWARHRLFDRHAAVVLYERCIASRHAKVTKTEEKPTKKWKPLPLTTVELQKMATKFLHLTGQEALAVAEKLYNNGFISYPRTETDRFDKAINLQALVQKQIPSEQWGQFAQGLVNGAFRAPRQGRNDDKAHPPIHPITFASPAVLGQNERKVYEFVVRRFLACCSEDAKGVATDVEIAYGDEVFTAHGVIVLERNYLDVYKYENWTGTAILPKFTVGERFEPTEALLVDGKTTPPGYLTEADLIALMDANGIGTDATMAEHIEKIQERQYARAVERGNRGGNEDAPAAPAARGGGRGRGGRGQAGRGGRGGTAGRGGGENRGSGIREFIPTALGVALIQGFDRMSFDMSLGKPFLRKEMELKMKAICEGRADKERVLRQSLLEYRQVYNQSSAELHILKNACRQYVLGHGEAAGGAG
ncbi:DNA topoisomerase [Lasiosphaeris hirsuta]|uniref:DNA topoisomerase n=1 Tax=Lasiosphaeris hirsuta TaxID=260670 RepID=A0AA40DRU9_9PEZI|nr:DNA topoisomerase [Lasiosphaeris hirsuta]